MKLSTKQAIFTANIASLIVFACSKGYKLTFGEAWRPRETAELYAREGRGIASSLHCSRLAVDFNLFKNGRYLTSTEDHRPLGDYWKTLHPLNRWGGDFRRRDGNHYSMTHNNTA